MNKGDTVFHPVFGEGTIRFIDGPTAGVRFAESLEECLLTELEFRQSTLGRLEEEHFDETIPAVCRVMASAIRSVNDEWGVFASSRINLLPHQLWVCRRILETAPSRWLVADDVGLGKTIEAGLVLLSLRSANRLRRCLIIAPASLTVQWQERMLRMFDLRFQLYRAQEDTRKNNQFWKGERLVIASMQTLGMDKDNRINRLLEAEEWDMVVVDEAHRLNIEERSKGTLGYQLLDKMQKAARIKSLLFFTGTPHKGKDFSFFSLLSLLRPDLYSDAKKPDSKAYENIPLVMIRNNKQKVTDMGGKKLFKPVTIHKEFYSYSDTEANFYDTLTEFIINGRIYAKDQSAAIQKVIFFLLTTIQKLASSSIAAILKALKNRVQLLEAKLSEASSRVPDEDTVDVMMDDMADYESDSAEKLESLLPDEIASLNTLIGLAEEIESETKMEKILATIKEKYSNEESILFFTEYKATQALLTSLLRKEFGHDSVVFINGDEALTFNDNHEEARRETMKRQTAAEKFNNGSARFLVSTEAAGEGIDLQQNSHVLFHVDLPWNPMRLHQRLGRLHRYGQKYPVEVHLFRNPETVESRIWECLEMKLETITRAFQNMDDPEDMCQAVIGTVSSSLFTDLFAIAPSKNEKFDKWFDAKTATFGGKDAISEVRKLFGKVSRFDFGSSYANLPQVDLKDLMPYIKLNFARMNHKIQKTDSPFKISFKTPKNYIKNLNIASQYNLVFSRKIHCDDTEDVAGLGLAIIDHFVNDGCNLSETCAVLPGIRSPLFIFRIRDRTTVNKQMRQRIIAVTVENNTWKLIRDWELLLLLNKISLGMGGKPETNLTGKPPEKGAMEQARIWLEQNLAPLNLPYQLADIEPFACLCVSLCG